MGRSTPHFHDILLENVEVGNGVVAGVIVGLPEAPVLGLTLRNTDLQATTGMQVGYANVELAQVQVQVQVKVAEGKGIVLGPGATVTGSSAELPRRDEDARPKGFTDG